MLTLKAPAKINWFLNVLDRRDDGYHNVVTLMQCIGLYDTLVFEPSEEILVDTSVDIPVKENLVYRAAVMLRDSAAVRRGVRIRLFKEIPMGAGLGGGSSDAACVLMGLNTFWGVHIDYSGLCAIGARLGSDVPFFFSCPMALAEGRGELVSSLGKGIPGHLLLVKPAVHVSTAWAYGTLAEKRRGGGAVELTKSREKDDTIVFAQMAVAAGTAEAIRPLINNDFEGVITERFPLIAELKRKVLDEGADLALMSGSGPTVVGYFRERERALRAMTRFSAHWARVVETLV